jgi:hypothetical protein
VNVRPFLDPPRCLIPKEAILHRKKIEEDNTQPKKEEQAAQIEDIVSPGMLDSRGTLVDQCLKLLEMFEAELDGSTSMFHFVVFFLFLFFLFYCYFSLFSSLSFRF